jgi:hypothetical protein
MNRLRPTNRTVLAHLAPNDTNYKSLENRYLDTAPPSASDYPGVGIARSGKIFHSCRAPAHVGNRQPAENCIHATQDSG